MIHAHFQWRNGSVDLMWKYTCEVYDSARCTTWRWSSLILGCTNVNKYNKCDWLCHGSIGVCIIPEWGNIRVRKPVMYQMPAGSPGFSERSCVQNTLFSASVSCDSISFDNDINGKFRLYDGIFFVSGLSCISVPAIRSAHAVQPSIWVIFCEGFTASIILYIQKSKNASANNPHKHVYVCVLLLLCRCGISQLRLITINTAVVCVSISRWWTSDRASV